jgi:Cu-Zn family superoxide dismutase
MKRNNRVGGDIVTSKNRAELVMMACGMLALAACGKPAARSGESQLLAPQGWGSAGGPFIDRKGREIGRTLARQADGGVFIRIRATDLTPGWHGVHIHMTADCSDREDGFKKSGAHFDPDNHEHGLAHADGGERGDLPNIFANRDGDAQVEFFQPNVTLEPSEAGAAANGPFPLLDDDGFAIIIHANPDDHITQPIGGAGDRVACAAVGG